MLSRFIKCLFVICFLPWIMSAAEKTKTVSAEGFGETIAGAIKNAKENAVRKVFGEVVDSVSEMKNDRLIESTIVASSGFIISSEIIKRPLYDPQNKYYIVTIRAVVASEKVKDQIYRFKKTSRRTNIAAQLQIAKKNEKASGNILELLNWYIGELPRTVAVENAGIKLDNNNNVVVHYTLNSRIDAVQNLQDQVRRALLKNGFRKLSEWGSISRSNRSLFVFPPANKNLTFTIDVERDRDTEMYQNTDIVLFFGKHNDRNHPLNYCYDPRTRTWFEISIITKENRRRVLVNEEFEIMNSYWVENGSKDSRYSSFVPYIGRVSPRDAGFAFFANRRDRAEFYRMEEPMAFKMGRAEFANAAALEFTFISKYPSGDVKRTLLRRVPVEITHFSSMANSRKNVTKAMVAFFIKFHRAYYKHIVPRIELKHGPQTNTGKLKMEFLMNNRDLIHSIRKIKDEFDNLGITFTWERFRRISSSMEKNKLKWGVPGLYEGSFSVDVVNLIAALKKEMNKYSYRLVVKYKDGMGNVLQKQSIKLPRWVTHSCIFYNDSGYVNYRRRFVKPFYGDFECPVQFDIPADYQKIKKIECCIEERVQK